MAFWNNNDALDQSVSEHVPLTINIKSGYITPRTVEDEVRKLPQNQGINEDEMWRRIDAEVSAVKAHGMLNEVDYYAPPETGNVHGKA
jgi:energy-coupling factor transporter ATP-binding protein EcfA2